MYNPKSKESIEENRVENVMYQFPLAAKEAGIEGNLRDDTKRGFWSVFIWEDGDGFSVDTTVLKEPVKVPSELDAEGIILYLKKNNPEYFL